MIDLPGRLIEEAAAAVAAGRLIVVPTDTVYGVGARPDDPEATSRLFEAKGRSGEVPLPVLVPSLSSAAAVASLDDRTERVARRAWPGAVTLVLPRAPRAAGWALGGDPATIGVRVPRHSLAAAVLARTGPLAVSSANRSGEPTPVTCDAIRGVFADAVSVYVCDAGELTSRPSTVVDLTGPRAVVLREGALASADLLRLLSD